MDILSTQFLTLFLFTIGASFIQRVSGFGFGIFIMTILPYLLGSYGEATTLSGLLALVTSGVIVIHHFREIPWRKLMPILCTFCFISFFAISSLGSIDSSILKKILGVTLLAVSIYFLFLQKRISMRPTLRTQLSMGTLSGMMGGFFGMQGPPAVLYFLGATDSKAEYLALSQAFFFFGNLVMTLFRFQNGFLTHTVLECWIWCLVGVGIGMYIGKLVYERLPIERIRMVCYSYIGISGLIAIIF